MARFTVVGVEQVGDDWLDAWGHYWAWDAAADAWHHDRSRCRLADARSCERGTKPARGTQWLARP